MSASAVVVHSLGNFVFDMDFQTKTGEGIFLEIVLWGGKVKAVEPVPYVIDNAFTPRLVRGDRATGILADVWRSSRGPFAHSGCGRWPLVQRQAPRPPPRPAHPIEWTPVEDARSVPRGGVAGVGDAAKPYGGNAGLGERPMVTCEVFAWSGGDVVSAAPRRDGV